MCSEPVSTAAFAIRRHVASCGAAVWHAATTTPRDRKELLGTLIEEVIVKVERDKSVAHLTLPWKGGALTEIDLALPRKRQATVRTAGGDGRARAPTGRALSRHS